MFCIHLQIRQAGQKVTAFFRVQMKEEFFARKILLDNILKNSCLLSTKNRMISKNESTFSSAMKFSKLIQTLSSSSYICCSRAENDEKCFFSILHFEIDTKRTIVSEIVHFLSLKQAWTISHQITQWICLFKVKLVTYVRTRLSIEIEKEEEKTRLLPGQAVSKWNVLVRDAGNILRIPIDVHTFL